MSILNIVEALDLALIAELFKQRHRLPLLSLVYANNNHELFFFDEHVILR